MIQWLMALALHERIVVIGAAVVLLVGGLFSFTQLDIEAYPDPVQPMTEVLTLPGGFSAEEVERLVTVPTEYGLSGMLHSHIDGIDFALRIIRRSNVFRLGQ